MIVQLMTVKRMTGRLNDSQCECQSRGIPVSKMTGSVRDSQGESLSRD